MAVRGEDLRWGVGGERGDVEIGDFGCECGVDGRLLSVALGEEQGR